MYRETEMTTMAISAMPLPSHEIYKGHVSQSDSKLQAKNHVALNSTSGNTNTNFIASGSIKSRFEQALAGIDVDECDAHGENAFFVCDLARVYAQHQRWLRELPMVRPFFAVKCNPDPVLLKMMANLGMGFDCASHPEIESVLRHDIDPLTQIIYANPCKAPSFIRHAKENNVQYMTFDNEDELVKVKRYFPEAKLVLRILTDDSGSVCQLGLKFGAELSVAPVLFRKAKELGLDVVGVSFHVGSGCTNVELYDDALARSRKAFDYAKEAGYDLNLVDIGGGFDDDTFESIAAVVRRGLDKHFGEIKAQRPELSYIAEPGRYYVSRAFELATNIIARRNSKDDGEHEMMYYINDGVYGAFNCCLFDHKVCYPGTLTINGEWSMQSAHQASWSRASVWGPTCDSIDVVQKEAVLPADQLRVGDWLWWEDMGAYTICAASQFNGFRTSTVQYTIDAPPEVEAVIRKLT